MSSWNAWRYPAFYIGPKYSLVDFTFKPPHTLFMDASLQAQQDADLIAPGDRANTDYVMDVVTHQPLCRHEAIKGADNVFYWNLDSRHQSQTVGLVQSTAQIVRHDGKMSSEGDLRANYEEWFWGLGKFDKDKSRLLRSRSKFLVGVTKPKNMAKWERITQNLIWRNLTSYSQAMQPGSELRGNDLPSSDEQSKLLLYLPKVRDVVQALQCNTLWLSWCFTFLVVGARKSL